MDPKLDLASVKAKLAWARSHFDLVDGEISTWLNGNPHQLVYERNEQFTKHWFRVKIIGAVPDFQRWALIIGDCVTNLRDALDHLIFAIAQLDTSPRPEKRDKAAFIIADTLTDFKEWSRGKLVSVPDPVRKSVLSFSRSTATRTPEFLHS